MTAEEAEEIVRRLDPAYAAEIEKARLTEAHYVWLGAAERLMEAQSLCLDPEVCNWPQGRCLEPSRCKAPRHGGKVTTLLWVRPELP